MKIQSRVKVYTFALTLYSVGLIVIFIMTSDYHQHRKMMSKERFNFAVEKVISRIQNRFKQYEYGLKGLRGIYLTSPTLTWSQFITYSESRDYKYEFPGALGIGHVTRVFNCPTSVGLLAAQILTLPPSIFERVSFFSLLF